MLESIEILGTLICHFNLRSKCVGLFKRKPYGTGILIIKLYAMFLICAINLFNN